MAIEKVEAFKTSDGKVFTAKHEANAHEEKIIIKEKISKMVDKDLYNGMNKDTVIEFIMENKAEIFTALSTRIH